MNSAWTEQAAIWGIYLEIHHQHAGLWRFLRMILAICVTWARVKRVISADDWFFGCILALVEIMLEIGVLTIAIT